jgi:hypothetical protein
MLTLSLIEKMRMDMSAISKAGMVNRENVMSVAHTIAKRHFGCGRNRAFTYKDQFTYCLKALYNVIKVIEAGAWDDLNIVAHCFGSVSWDGSLVTRKSYYDTICIMGDYLKIIKGEYPEKAFIAARSLCENCGLYLSQNI